MSEKIKVEKAMRFLLNWQAKFSVETGLTKTVQDAETKLNSIIAAAVKIAAEPEIRQQPS